MNGRIKELALKAGFEEHLFAGGGMPLDILKFYELIVRECSEFVRECGMQPSVFTAADLLERFGVKISIPLGEEDER